MMRSLYSGVAGLKTHQVKMDVIGNNIANVNTTAYKSSSITFSELMSQTTQKASGPNSTKGTGGTNARQVGLGVKSAAININITGQGASQTTGNPFDIMLTGENFFIVNNGNENYFTRDGSFFVDGSGNLAMTSTGYNVMGWGVDEVSGNVKQDTVSALRIMTVANLTYPPEATSKGYVAGILDQNDKDVTSQNGKTVSLNLFDQLGYSYTAKFIFKQSDDPHNYSLEFSKLLDSNGKEVDITGVDFGATTRQTKTTNIVFNSDFYQWNEATGSLCNLDGTGIVSISSLFENGNLKPYNAEIQVNGKTATVQDGLDAIARAYGYEGSTDEFLNLYINSRTTPGRTVTVMEMLLNRVNQLPAEDNDVFPTDAKSFTTDGRIFDGFMLKFNPNTGDFSDIGGGDSITLSLSQLGGNFSDIDVDFSQCTMCDNKGTSTLTATSGDFDGLGAGRRIGDMIGISVQQNGMIYASYDNGMTKLLGQIATASFANASGLEKKGDNLYGATLNSGVFNGVGVDVTSSGGYMTTGQLEMSNVDLSTEFTEMITTQRGFQANSRIITVSDTLLEELTNLKR